MAMRTTGPEPGLALSAPPLAPVGAPPPRTSPSAGRPPNPDRPPRGSRPIRFTRLLRATTRWVRGWHDALTGPLPVSSPNERPAPPPAGAPLEPLRRVVLTDEVSRTLFGEYADHRETDRGAEEIGWVLLGLREADRAVVLATLPAGADRDASEAHVWFNAAAQALAYRILWQAERRLTMVGVVHTHPGKLRHPSRGDFEGDRVWVRNLRGEEGVFGIGTVFMPRVPTGPHAEVAEHPDPQTQTFGDLRFDWYTLGVDDKRYTPVPVELTVGPDLAACLRPIWDLIEEHAERLDRLARQMAKVRFVVGKGKEGPALTLEVGLGDPNKRIRVVLEGKTVRYFYEADGQVSQPDLPTGTAPDQGIYLLLAELAARE